MGRSPHGDPVRKPRQGQAPLDPDMGLLLGDSPIRLLSYPTHISFARAAANVFEKRSESK